MPTEQPPTESSVIEVAPAPSSVGSPPTGGDAPAKESREALRVELAAANTGPASQYALADRSLWSRVSIPGLEPFRISDPSAPEPPEPTAEPPPDPSAAAERVIFAGRVEVSGSWHDVDCREQGGRFQLRSEQGGRFEVWPERSLVRILDLRPPELPAPAAEFLCGPVFGLALAHRGVTCLQASAIASEDQVVAFVGSEASFRCDLVRLLAGDPGSPWRLVADRVLPVRADGAVFPCFPQPGGGPQPWSAGRPRSLRLAAMYIVHTADTLAESPSLAARARGLLPSEATLSLELSVLGGRFFDAELARAQLRLGSRLSESLPMRRLTLPHDSAHVGEAVGLVKLDLVKSFGLAP